MGIKNKQSGPMPNPPSKRVIFISGQSFAQCYCLERGWNFKAAGIAYSVEQMFGLRPSDHLVIASLPWCRQNIRMREALKYAKMREFEVQEIS